MKGALIVTLMLISMMKMRKTLSCTVAMSVNNWLLGWYSFDNRSAYKNSGADEVPIKWGEFELGGGQLVVDCIHISGSFRLYSKMLWGGKVFLVMKNLVNIRSEPHLFFYIAVPKIGEVVDSDPNNYLAMFYNIPGKSVQVAELGMVRPNDSPTESDIDITCFRTSKECRPVFLTQFSPEQFHSEKYSRGQCQIQF